MDKTREFLKSIGLPGGDAYDLPNSEKRFKDGGQYRFEVPGIQGPKVMKALLEAIDSYGLYLHRVTQTQGIMRLTDEEIAKMVGRTKSLRKFRKHVQVWVQNSQRQRRICVLFFQFCQDIR